MQINKQALFLTLSFFYLSIDLFSQFTKDSLNYKIGQMLMFGIGNINSVKEADSLFIELSKNKIGGIILFEKNINPKNSFDELQKLLKRIQAINNHSMFIAIDEEGGKVNRLKEKYGFHKTRSAKSLGEENNLDSTYYYAKKTSRLLNNLGININYAPTLDLSINLNNPVIYKAERSYGRQPNHVISHARSFILSHREDSVITVIKHFPGHGSSDEDTHLEVTDISDSWLVEEIYPYKYLIDSGLVDAIMSAHVVNKQLDEEMLPSTLSNKVINGLLRNFLGYKGVVFSDDMQMQAITKYFGLESAIEKSINAGVDILLFSNNQLKKDQVTIEDIISIIRNKIISG